MGCKNFGIALELATKMGMSCDQLVHAAVLLDNPHGLTKEEYVAAIDRVHISPYTKFTPDDPWDSYCEWEGKSLRGSKGMADALGLNLSQPFEEFQQPYLDSRGLIVNRPRFLYLLGLNETGHSVTTYHVVNHLQNVPRIIDKPAYRSESLEGLWNNLFNHESIVDLAREELNCLRGKGKSSLEKAFATPFEFRGNRFYAIFSVETYEKEEDVWLKWPQFHPDNQYDFNQDRGNFEHVLLGRQNFWWKFQNGRYFLDPETFDRIPASLSVTKRFRHSLGYTDLVLTAEAIRQGAWKMLSRRGFDFTEDFLHDFPPSRERVEQAIFDSHTFLSAKGREGVTYQEVLRQRVVPWSYRQGKER